MTWSGFDAERASSSALTDSRVERRQEKRWEAEEWIRALLRESALWLLEGSAAPDDGDAIVKRLLKAADEDGDAEACRLRRNFLIRGIDDGNKVGRWKLKVPSQTLRAPLPRPAIRDENFWQIASVDQLRDALIQACRDPGFPSLDKVLKIRRFGHATERLDENDLASGLALLGAILFGGVASMDRLGKIAHLEPGRLTCYKNLLWVDWPEGKHDDEANDQWGRWFGVTVSGVFMALAHRRGQFPLVQPTSNVTLRQAIWKRISAILALLDLPGDQRPTSLNQLLTWVTTWLYYNVPPFLAAHASGKTNAASVPPDVLIRLLTGIPISRTENGEAKSDDVLIRPLPPRPPEALPQSGTADLSALRRDLRVALKHDREKHKAIKSLNAFLKRTDLPPSFVRLAEWVRELCDHHKDGDVKRRLSSIHTYLSRIDRRLPTVLEARDPALFNETEFEALYIEILTGLGKQVDRALHPLMLFHRYLVSAHGVSPEVGAAFEGRGNDATVDGNMISERDYQNTLLQLDPIHSNQPAWLAKMQRAALILGYRAELRRGEIRRLRLGDIFGAVFGVLYVRSTDKGQTKSRAGIRKLSLEGHLPDAERAILHDFVMSRLSQITGKDDLQRILSPYDDSSAKIRLRPLFEQPDQAGELIPDKSLFDPIVRAMVRVTFDPDAHMHMARKSGQNADFLGMMEETLPGCSGIFDPSGRLAESGIHLRQAMLGHQGPDRRCLWATSTSAGHSSPATTTGSYLLVLDWLLAYALKLAGPRVDDQLMASLINQTENNIRSIRCQKSLDPDDWVYWVGHGHREWLRQVAPALDAERRSNPMPSTPSASASCRPPLSGSDTLFLLHAILVDHKDPEKTARQYGLLPDEAKRWTDQAIALDQLECRSPVVKYQPRSRPDPVWLVEREGLLIERRIPIMTFLRQRDERDRLNDLTRHLYRFACERRKEAADWLNRFWKYHRPRFHEVAFTTLATARDFIEQLVTVAPNETDQLGYRLYPLETRKSASAEEQRVTWARELSLAAESIELFEGLSRQAEGDRVGTLAIYLRHEHTLTRETLEKHQKSGPPKMKWEKEESLALTGACYAITIWLLAEYHAPADLQPEDSDSSDPASAAKHQNDAVIPGPAESSQESDRPELVILCGIPGSGKTTLCENAYPSHTHISLDTTRSGSRKAELKAFMQALESGESIVIDNTNLTPAHRARYIGPAAAKGYRIIGIQLQISVDEAIHRVRRRLMNKLPAAVVVRRAKELVNLDRSEGFDVIRTHPSEAT